ncbi:hypothetical protein NK362_26010, partial [Salmonella enterica]|uniref:hypothetical protein n=1 Tax=Salmonella enterica TaxID=28901 RepID=UPI0022B6AC52
KTKLYNLQLYWLGHGRSRRRTTMTVHMNMHVYMHILTMIGAARRVFITLISYNSATYVTRRVG